ncbi:MAG: hypothetical protein LQ352_007942, partial [Teloschistes flavicans]
LRLLARVDGAPARRRLERPAGALGQTLLRRRAREEHVVAASPAPAADAHAASRPGAQFPAAARVVVVEFVVGVQVVRVVVGAGAGGAAEGVEGAEGEEAREQGPEVGDVGDEDGGDGFADVPVQIDEGAVAGGEVVVTVENRGEDLWGLKVFCQLDVGDVVGFAWAKIYRGRVERG